MRLFGHHAERLRWLIVMACATLIAGLAWRFAIPGLPWFAWKYGGSALWAALVYFLVAMLWPKGRWFELVAAACLIALVVEFSRLVSTPWLDAFRASLPGRLTLGSVFSLVNLPAYFAGIAVAGLVDARRVKAAVCR